MDALQSRLGFPDETGARIDPELLQLALTHRSYAYEHGGLPHNERLEFLGDSVLGQAATVRLYRDNPELPEGELAKRRAAIVSGAALAEIAGGLGLGEFIRLGRGEQLSGGRGKVSILADCVEAVIGACYLSAGADAATALVLRLIGPLMADPARRGAALDPKTALQELADAHGAPAPVYDVVGSGPDHSRTFTATVTIEGVTRGTGTGSSKKQAEMAAALEAWERAADPDAGTS